jgi:hypothetical protein
VIQPEVMNCFIGICKYETLSDIRKFKFQLLASSITNLGPKTYLKDRAEAFR